ncbi:MAG: hypothetical protein WD708_06765 [Kiritimatiellia bacterium]
MIRIKPKPVPQHLRTLWFPTGTLMLILFGFSVWIQPLNRKRHHIQTELSRLEQELGSYTALENDMSLAKQAAISRRRHLWLTREWERSIPNIKRFREQAVPEIISQSSEGRIDFKIALFESRYRLSQLALAHATTLPPDLGIPDTIGANESADIRLGQLTATVLLLEKCITKNIPIIHEVQPLPPELLPLEKTPLPALAFFPVHIRMRASFEEFVSLLEHLQEEPLFYYLQHLRIENNYPENTDDLTIYSVWSVAGHIQSSRMPDRELIGPPHDDPDHFFY